MGNKRNKTTKRTKSAVAKENVQLGAKKRKQNHLHHNASKRIKFSTQSTVLTTVTNVIVPSPSTNVDLITEAEIHNFASPNLTTLTNVTVPSPLTNDLTTKTQSLASPILTPLTNVNVPNPSTKDDLITDTESLASPILTPLMNVIMPCPSKNYDLITDTESLASPILTPLTNVIVPCPSMSDDLITDIPSLASPILTPLTNVIVPSPSTKDDLITDTESLASPILTPLTNVIVPYPSTKDDLITGTESLAIPILTPLTNVIMPCPSMNDDLITDTESLASPILTPLTNVIVPCPLLNDDLIIDIQSFASPILTPLTNVIIPCPCPSTNDDLITDTESLTSPVLMNLTENCKKNSGCRQLMANDIINTNNLMPSHDTPYLIEKEDTEKEIFVVKGRRIVDIQFMFEQLKQIARHNRKFDCGLDNLFITSEIKDGLTSRIQLKCSMCNEKFFFHTCDPHTEDVLDLNRSAVSGMITTGIGISQFQELSSAMDINIMNQKKYSQIHDDISNQWEKTLLDVMAAAAARERQAAIEEGRVKDGAALIDVVADGCWSKRSYKTNYSALSGAAAIVGKRFGEVLYLGVKNKYCVTCARADKSKVAPKEHKCFKNYSGPSTGMESEILVEGFKSSLEMYNIIYARMIADGDSSTYAKIVESRPYPNHSVEKIECRNHIFRNMCNKIRVITKETKYPIVLRKLVTVHRMLGVRKAIVSAIEGVKTQQGDMSIKIKELFEDIMNSLNHGFGDHSKCKGYYCLPSTHTSENVVPLLAQSTLWYRLQCIIRTVASNSRSLIHNVDSNTVERFNGIVAKCVGGKRVNYSLRQSYQTRCAAAAVSFNTRRPLYMLQKYILGKSPRSGIKKFEESRIKRCRPKARRVRRRLNFGDRTANGDNHYGEKCSKIDMPEQEFEMAKANYLENIKKSEADRKEIERNTVLQRDSSEWLELRRTMITASNFGVVIKRKPETSCSALVINMVYKTHSLDHVPSIKYGVDNEPIALRDLAAQENVNIEPCGIFIDGEIPYLAASPDGIIGDDMTVEVKCAYAARNMTVDEALQKKKVKFWIRQGDIYTINKNDSWYYQLQGALHITKRNTCLFAVWFGENRLKVEYIQRDDDFWENKMVEKLKQFYLNCILPELVDPRHPKKCAIREPSYIIKAMEKKKLDVSSKPQKRKRKTDSTGEPSA